MRPRAIALRVLRIAGISLFALLLVAFALIQFQQHLLRRRAERLLADFHSIRLNQTTWPEAQAIMQRWGKWGHAHAPCTASDCEYAITVTDTASRLISDLGDAWEARLFDWSIPRMPGRLGMCSGELDLRFLVQDSRIQRTALDLRVDAKGSAWGNVLKVFAQGRPTLVGPLSTTDTPRNDGHWILGNSEQLDEHPDYKIGAPDGCEGCISEEFTYTPELAQSELLRLTSWDLSCLTRFRGCRDLEDLAPVMMENRPRYEAARGIPQPKFRVTPATRPIPTCPRTRVHAVHRRPQWVGTSTPSPL